VKTPSDASDHLDDIEKAIRKALDFVLGMDLDGFLADEKPPMRSFAPWKSSAREPSGSPRK